MVYDQHGIENGSKAMDNVAYSPKIKFNFLSVSKMMKDGCKKNDDITRIYMLNNGKH